ncbi:MULTISPECIES: glycine zipper 2TM domain-containing protein [Caballeronia]|uniref:glycine zipper 2TM domain-containing protein n=1 Tax=Caballeronia TaxID=1827195 RepID=UPI00045EFB8B|nr:MULTISPECIES: glycine zipper 2TM domain-containing protein [unclassified Caballeronia]MCE4542780.1 glycine zipper 2TM domain-containing protein [Caballeronia sp. PC1]MCE4568164.1 glycine zipper 2TM domain-containing protein [Caballeronia sp. CLC5]BAO85489.1 17 kDa surface antigen [Burkholderia sp. RPE67]
MNVATEIQTKPSRIHPLVAAAAVSVILACGTGIAAMTGLLPLSKATATAAAVTASPLVDVQTAKPVTQASAQAPAQEAASLPRAVRGHHPTPVHRPAPAPAQQNTSYTPATAPAYDPYAGEVTAVNAVQTAQPTTGLGAIGGAVAGGLAGTQIGNGRGRTAATIIGAIGGGLAGNQIERVVHKATTYQVQVRMNDGSVRSFNYETAPGVAVGQKVHVSGETLTPA